MHLHIVEMKQYISYTSQRLSIYKSCDSGWTRANTKAYINRKNADKKDFHLIAAGIQLSYSKHLSRV